MYQRLAHTRLGHSIFSALKMPIPPQLDRQQTEAVFFKGNLVLGAAPQAELLPALCHTIARKPHILTYNIGDIIGASDIKKATKRYKIPLIPYQSNQADPVQFKAMVFDASGIHTTQDFHYLFDFFQPLIKKLAMNGRVLLLARTPHTCTPAQATAQTALIGFIRSLAKEVGKQGATVQLIQADYGVELPLLEGPIRFLLSPKSAYISGQVIHISAAQQTVFPHNAKPLRGKHALVTGAARGVGAAIARTLAKAGAQVICLDLPDTVENLSAIAEEIAGEPLLLDITAPRAAQQIVDMLRELSCDIDILVHNAGITRDKTLANMTKPQWNATVSVNLTACEQITHALLEHQLIASGGRVICIASVSGIAGNFGQTNYATSKAGLLGFVTAMTPLLQSQNITINAIAPGFIETEMTQQLPTFVKEIGRRFNSLKQSGLPIDVAEAVTFLAEPSSAGLQGNVLRVCGQNLLGA